MDQIEGRVQLPQGARPLRDYARYYADGENGDVVAVYLIPDDDEPRPGETCEELSANFTSREVPCKPMPSPWAMRAGQRRWMKDHRELPSISDGGCMEVDVDFDVAKATVKSVACNGMA